MHLKDLLVWTVRGKQRKERELCCHWILGKRSPERRAKQPLHGKQWTQLTYWHSRRQPVWRHPQIQGQILPGTELMKNKKDSQQRFSLSCMVKKAGGFCSHILYSLIVHCLHGLIWRSINNGLQMAKCNEILQGNTREETSQPGFLNG